MKFFTISEMLYSATAVKRGIWNGCSRTQEDNLEALGDNVLDPARRKYGRPIHISSGYRCAMLNSIIHGAHLSQHMNGEAADIYTDEGPQGNLELARIIVREGRMDQLILEEVPGTSLTPNWVHVSWKRNGLNRGEILKKVIGTNAYKRVTREEVLA